MSDQVNEPARGPVSGPVNGDSSNKANEPEATIPHHMQTEKYGGGHIEARHGRVNGWLVAVYVALFVWAIYYGFTYWGGLGPGLDY